MNSENKHITDRIVWFFKDNNKDIFETIYKRNLWESKESVSGKGSEKVAVQSIIRELPLIFEKYGIKILSIGFFVDKDSAIVWRGGMASKHIEI